MQAMSNGDDLESEHSNPLKEIEVCKVLQSELHSFAGVMYIMM